MKNDNIIILPNSSPGDVHTCIVANTRCTRCRLTIIEFKNIEVYGVYSCITEVYISMYSQGHASGAMLAHTSSSYYNQELDKDESASDSQMKQKRSKCE